MGRHLASLSVDGTSCRCAAIGTHPDGRCPHDVPVHPIAAGIPTDVRRSLGTGVLLVAAAVLQLLGQVLLRLGGDGMGDVAHLVLVLAAVSLLAAMAQLARVIGPGAGTWLGLALLFVGQALALAVLAIDLDLASASVDTIRTLDTWDFLAVVGAVVLVLELRRRRGAGPGTELALIALAVPPVDGLVVVAAVTVVLGFGALALALVAGRGRGPAWLAAVTVMAYVVAGTVSWQRAALAVVVLAWAAHHLRTSRAS